MVKSLMDVSENYIFGKRMDMFSIVCCEKVSNNNTKLYGVGKNKTA